MSASYLRVSSICAAESTVALGILILTLWGVSLEPDLAEGAVLDAAEREEWSRGAGGRAAEVEGIGDGFGRVRLNVILSPLPPAAGGAAPCEAILLLNPVETRGRGRRREQIQIFDAF